MSWHPNDLLTDADLTAYERKALTTFGQTNWLALRAKAFEDWLFPILRGAGYDPLKLRTRFNPSVVYGYTASAYTDRTSAAASTTADDLNLAATFATPGTDALYVGSTQPFRGVALTMKDTRSSVAAGLVVKFWSGSWEELSIEDQTSGLRTGGSVLWALPPNWSRRSVNSSALLYWAQVTVAATPTSALAGQLSTLRASLLRAPVTFRTLQLIFREAPTGMDGPRQEKAAFYAAEADAALARALPLIAGEFDTDDTDTVGTAETPAAQPSGWRLERA